ncbi:MAG UNVERIFIED_CONTAM: NADH-quinone oxidoreductase subunit M [Planctomycetaceae bacterium]|jgi:NADH-quinone oxidoreductase subunit M
MINLSQLPILSISILLPLLGAFFVAIFANCRNGSNIAKQSGLWFSLITFFLTIYVMYIFDYQKIGYQLEENYTIAPIIGLNFHLGIDGISLLFVALTALLVLLCMIFSYKISQERAVELAIAFLLLDSIVIAFFLSVNLLLFYIFFEAMLIPMYIIIGVFGGKNRIYAAFKFFLYTFLGSVFFLIAMIAIYTKLHTFDMKYLAANTHLISDQLPYFIWVCMFVAMAVKIPMVPFHTWLPDAHVEAPTTGSVILAGILLKVGAYGMIRILLQILPNMSMYFAEYVMYLSVFAIIYASLVAMAQDDMKKMIAYSSVAHMGYVTAGIFSFNMNGLEGALMQMLSHGFISSGLFFVIGMLYDRMHTRMIRDYGGVASVMPIKATFFMILVMASIGLPATSGFVSEFLSLVGIFKYNFYLAIVASFGVVLGAIYMLSLYKRVMFGVINNNKITKIKDLAVEEVLILLVLCSFVIFVGIKPEFTLSIFRLGLNGIV